MVKIIPWIGLLIILFVLGKALSSLVWSNPLSHVKNFRIFYGTPTVEIIHSISKNDLAIIESVAFSNPDLELLKKSNTTLFGYVSLMELENWNAKLKEHVVEEDYIKQNGKRLYIEQWDTYIMDIREPHYRDVLLWKIDQMIVKRELDGIFFDTVDDLEYYFSSDPQLVKDMQLAYVTLLEEIEQRYPKLLIIQNRGFQTYKEETHSYIDGVLWEDFQANNPKEQSWTNEWITYFKKEQSSKRVKLLTVVMDENSEKLSEFHHFTPFFRSKNTYQTID